MGQSTLKKRGNASRGSSKPRNCASRWSWRRRRSALRRRRKRRRNSRQSWSSSRISSRNRRTKSKRQARAASGSSPSNQTRTRRAAATTSKVARTVPRRRTTTPENRRSSSPSLRGPTSLTKARLNFPVGTGRTSCEMFTVRRAARMRETARNSYAPSSSTHPSSYQLLATSNSKNTRKTISPCSPFPTKVCRASRASHNLLFRV